MSLINGVYTNPGWTNDEAPALNAGNLNDISNAIVATQTEVGGLRAAVGSPLTASLVSEMTDGDKVYVYTGSETGYTAGNWYYSTDNGTTWTSGGVYNAVACDTALSASSTNAVQNSVVNEAITDLKSDLTTDVQLLNNDVNNSDLAVFSGYIHSGGNWIANNAYSFVLFIVKPGDVIKLTRNATNNTIFGWLHSFNFGNNIPVDFVNGTGLITVSSTAQQQYTAPDGANYLYIMKSAGSGSVNYMPDILTVNDFDRLQTANNRVVNTFADMLKIPDFDNVLVNNDINGNGLNFTANGYIHSTGIWSGESTGTHCVLKVEPGDTVRLKKNNSANCYYAWFSRYDGYEYGTIPPFVSGTTLNSVSDSSAVDLTVPNGCEYLYLHNIIANVVYFPEVLNINTTDRTHTIRAKADNLVRVVKDSATSLIVYTGNGSHTLTHQTIANKNLDTWRLTNATGNGQELWNEVDVEGPIKLKNENDYVSGYHGDEIFTNVDFLCDGNVFDFSSAKVGSVIYCKSFVACIDSDVYHDTDSVNKSFERHKRLVFVDNRLEIYNTYKCIDANGVDVQYATGTGLYPVSTSVVSGYTTNTTNRFVSEVSTPVNKWLDSVSYFGNGFTLNISVIFGKLDGYYGRVDYIPSQTRYKLYFFQHFTSGSGYLHLNDGDELYSGYKVEFE